MSQRLILPIPPNADDFKFNNNPLAFYRAVTDWMTQTKGKIETFAQQSHVPAQQSIVVGSYTLNTSLSGTMTGTDIANGLCSVVTALTNRGLLAPNAPGRGGV